MSNTHNIPLQPTVSQLRCLPSAELARLASNMRLLFVFLCFLLSLECGARTIAIPFTVGEPIALSKEQRSKLFNQCSRSAPKPTEIFLAPTNEEIHDLELRLERYAAEIYEAGKPAPANVTYARQYVSFQVEGKRKVYGNFFSASMVRSHPKGQAAVICDGGSSFWGVVYDPDSKQFEQLEMNGPL